MELPVYFSPRYVIPSLGAVTYLKAGWVAKSLRKSPIEGVRLLEPQPANDDLLELAHSKEHIENIRDGRDRERFLQSELNWSSKVFTAAIYHVGGLVAASLEAFRERRVIGSLSSGFHHARRDAAKGFCVFNGLAIATHAVLKAGARRVLILDLDAHGGGGTWDILSGVPEVVHVDLAIDPFDRYRPTAPSSYHFVDSPEHYFKALDRELERRGNEMFDLVLCNAGMDVFENDAGGGLSGMTAAQLFERERRVFGWARQRNLPVAFCLAGGYSGSGNPPKVLVDLHRSTLEAALGR